MLKYTASFIISSICKKMLYSRKKALAAKYGEGKNGGYPEKTNDSRSGRK